MDEENYLWHLYVFTTHARKSLDWISAEEQMDLSIVQMCQCRVFFFVSGEYNIKPKWIDLISLKKTKNVTVFRKHFPKKLLEKNQMGRGKNILTRIQ